MSGAPPWTAVQPGDTLSNQEIMFKRLDELMGPNGKVDITLKFIQQELEPILPLRSVRAIHKRLTMGLRVGNYSWHLRESTGADYSRLNTLKRDMIKYKLIDDDGIKLTEHNVKIIIGSEHGSGHSSSASSGYSIDKITFTSTRAVTSSWDITRAEAKTIPKSFFNPFIDMCSENDQSTKIKDITKKRYLDTGEGYNNPDRNKKFRGWTKMALKVYDLSMKDDPNVQSIKGMLRAICQSPNLPNLHFQSRIDAMQDMNKKSSHIHSYSADQKTYIENVYSVVVQGKPDYWLINILGSKKK